MKSATHLAHPEHEARPACGMLGSVYWAFQLSSDQEKVTCLRCKRYGQKRIANVERLAAAIKGKGRGE